MPKTPCCIFLYFDVSSILQVTSTKFVQPTFTAFLSDVNIFIYMTFFTFPPLLIVQKGKCCSTNSSFLDCQFHGTTLSVAEQWSPASLFPFGFLKIGRNHPLSIIKVKGNQTIKFMQVGGSLGLWLGLGILQVAYNIEKSFLNSLESAISKTTPTF